MSLLDRWWKRIGFALPLWLGVAGLIAAFDQLQSKVPLAILLASAIALLVALISAGIITERINRYLSSRVLEDAKERERVAEEAKVVAAFASLRKDAEFLGTFVNETLLRGRNVQHLRAFNNDHVLNSYVKNCDIRGTTLSTWEEYDGSNKGDQPCFGLKRVSVGGKALAFERLKESITVTWIFPDGTELPLGPDAVGEAIATDEERVTILDVHFYQPVFPDKPFKIRYQHSWPNAMYPGLDAILFPEPIFYSRGIKELRSKLSFDVLVTHIGAYWYDFDTQTCGAASSQPSSLSGDRTKFEWSMEFPSNNRLYFILFDRSGCTEEAMPEHQGV